MGSNKCVLQKGVVRKFKGRTWDLNQTLKKMSRILKAGERAGCWRLEGTARRKYRTLLG